jgi:hypothetical protein
MNDVRETILFRRLKKKCRYARALVSCDNIDVLCREASDRMKQVIAFHPQFTLHDAAHLLRVTELMGLVLGDTLSELNAIEITLLILAAHFHDQGMVPEAADRSEIEASRDFAIHRELWAIEHPNLREIDEQLGAGALDNNLREVMELKKAELLHARWSDFLRKTHGERSAELVIKLFGKDKRLEIMGVSLADVLAKMCASHVQDPHYLIQLPLDKLIGTHPVNLQYLALVLRLADVLDFDRERTPDALYRTIHFTSDVSIREWEKHRGVQGWKVDSSTVRFDMEFEHPIYERSARQFLDYIDEELGAAHDIVNKFPAKFSRYKLDLSLHVDRSDVGPKRDAYVYHDLEFSLSRDEIVKLLMTDKLYGTPSLCVRELLQNSLDALRYRRALFQSGDLEWKQGRVEFEHGVDEHGREFLRCTDDGAGMDEQVIVGFLTKVGRSYYRSPWFEQERIRFRQKGVDFDPCSQFGIGFMSCFMLGDRICIKTRRDYGPGYPYGTPWIVEINGLSSILTLRRGEELQPIGTTVRIACRRKPEMLTSEQDQIKLVETVKDYARAVEFPVEARCTVSEISGSVRIEDKSHRPLTFLETVGVKQLLRITQDISDLDKSGYITGAVTASFLADEEGRPVLENKEATWEVLSTSTGQNFAQPLRSLPADTNLDLPNLRLRLRSGESHSLKDAKSNMIFCADGIRVKFDSRAPSRAGRMPECCLIDTRGKMKPQLTPAREAVRKSLAVKSLFQLHKRAKGMIWAQLAAYLPEKLAHEIWWKLADIHSAPIYAIPSGVIWDRLGVPVGNTRKYLRFPEIRVATFEVTTLEVTTDLHRSLRRLVTGDGDEVQYGRVPLVLRFSELHMDGTGRLRLDVLPPASPLEPPFNPDVGLFTHIIPFRDELKEALCVRWGRTLVNEDHPLVAERIRGSDNVRKFLTSMFYSDPFTPVSELKDYELRERRNAGVIYASVSWEKLGARSRPPYKMYSALHGWSELTDDDLRSWSQTPVA